MLSRSHRVGGPRDLGEVPRPKWDVFEYGNFSEVSNRTSCFNYIFGDFYVVRISIYAGLPFVNLGALE